ncbi:MAG: hypothetical protein WDA09_02415 [Bacteriovoracaceae bacterium]
MKKIIALAGLAVLATNTAEASKARLLALGENLETAGSLYFSDNRNIFQNAAYIHEYKDGIYMEWGSQGTEFNSNYTVPGSNGNLANKYDSDTNPQAEGGFLKSHGKYVYGLYLGAESYITHEARNYLRLTNSANIHQDNQIDLFFGAAESEDFKWGVNVTYSNTKEDSNDSKQKSASIRLGVMGKKWEGYANVAVMNEAETADITGFGATGFTTGTGKDKFEGKRGWELGGSYDLGFAKAFGYWRHGVWEQDVDSASFVIVGTDPVPTGALYQGKSEFDTNRIRVGLGREAQLTDRTTLFTKLEYVMTKREVEGKGAVKGTANIDDYYVPLTIGLEHDATSWLTLRGSVTQYLVSEQDNDYGKLNDTPGTISGLVTAKYQPGKRSFQNSTNVNAGLTLKFGDLAIDGVIGTSSAGNIVDTKSENGVFSLDNLASRVAMTYRF